MATLKGKVLSVDTPLELGPVAIGMAIIEAMSRVGGEASSRGIVLLNDKVTGALLPIQLGPDGQPVKWAKVTASLYISREPLTEDEQKACDKMAADQNVRKTAKAAADQLVRDNEIKRAAALTREAILETQRAAR